MKKFGRKAAIALWLVVPVLIVACGSLRFFKSDADIGQLVADGAVIIDVRTTSEYADTHIEGAINIPLGKLRTEYVFLDSGRTYVTYCSHGLRSIKAVEILKENGFKHVFNGGAMSDIEVLHRLPAVRRVPG